MIDIENKVFDTVCNAILASYPNAICSSEYIDVPSSFPCVTIMESDNYTYTRSQDENLHENHAVLTYEINVYANSSQKKAEAKSIANIVDEQMQNMKFTRLLKSPVPNIDRTIYRIVLRYTAVISNGKEVDNDTVYQMYRR